MLDIGPKKENQREEIQLGKPQTIPAKKDKSLEMPQITSLEETDQFKIAGIFAFIATFLFVASFGLLFFLKSSKTSQLKSAQLKLDELNGEIKSSGLDKTENEAIRYKTGFSTINAFINSSFSWYTFYNELEKIIPKSIVLSNLSLGNKDTLTIRGEAGSYDDVAKFIDSLQNSQKFSDTQISNTGKVTETSKQVTKTNFELTTKIIKKAFKETK